MDPIEQIQKAILLIEERLFERIPIKDLAYQVFSSRFHFHRTFRAVTGSTVHQYILGRRLSEASKMLLHNSRPIAEIAFAVGFDSHEGFTRAFAKRVGTSPQNYRKQQQLFSILPALDLDSDSLRVGILEHPAIQEYPELYLAGVPAHKGYSRSHTADAWFQLLQACEQIPDLSPRWDSYGILDGQAWNHDSANFSFVACKQVHVHGCLPNGIIAITIPRGRYWRALVRGRRADLTAFYQDFFQAHEIIPSSPIIEHQNEYFISPEISPRELRIPCK